LWNWEKNKVEQAIVDGENDKSDKVVCDASNHSEDEKEPGVNIEMQPNFDTSC